MGNELELPVRIAVELDRNSRSIRKYLYLSILDFSAEETPVIDISAIARKMGASTWLSGNMIEAYDRNLCHIIFKPDTDFAVENGAITFTNKRIGKTSRLQFKDVVKIMNEDTGTVLWERK